MIDAAKIIAITGTIASGKSLVGKILTDHGYPVVDTDVVVHELFAKSEALKSSVQARFGASVLSDDGLHIDRKKLGDLIFEDAVARKDLEAIVHPATINECQRWVSGAAKKSKLVFVLVPLLYEAKQEGRYDSIWTVHTDETILRERLRQRNNLSDKEIDARLAAQLPQQEKMVRADKLIDNSGSIANTAAQVDLSLMQELFSGSDLEL